MATNTPSRSDAIAPYNPPSRRDDPFPTVFPLPRARAPEPQSFLDIHRTARQLQQSHARIGVIIDRCMDQASRGYPMGTDVLEEIGCALKGIEYDRVRRPLQEVVAEAEGPTVKRMKKDMYVCRGTDPFTDMMVASVGTDPISPMLVGKVANMGSNIRIKDEEGPEAFAFLLGRSQNPFPKALKREGERTNVPAGQDTQAQQAMPANNGPSVDRDLQLGGSSEAYGRFNYSHSSAVPDHLTLQSDGGASTVKDISKKRKGMHSAEDKALAAKGEGYPDSDVDSVQASHNMDTSTTVDPNAYSTPRIMRTNEGWPTSTRAIGRHQTLYPKTLKAQGESPVVQPEETQPAHKRKKRYCSLHGDACPGYSILGKNLPTDSPRFNLSEAFGRRSQRKFQQMKAERERQGLAAADGAEEAVPHGAARESDHE